MTTSRTALFQKSTRKNQEFERFLSNGQEAALLDATTSKYIPLSYFVTPVDATTAPAAATARRSSRNSHGLADKMPYESFRLINLQQRGSHAHSLVLFKSRAITTNPEQIAIFECNGQYVQSEIRVIHTYHPDADATDEPGTVYDVTQNYFSPISPKVCMNYGNDTYNPGYCGIFGIIAMVFRGGKRPPTTPAATLRSHRSAFAEQYTLYEPGGYRPPTAGATLYEPVGGSETPNSGGIGCGGAVGEAATKETTETKATKATEESENWLQKWKQLLKYMRQDIPDEPESHGCMGTNLAARVQEIIASHPSTTTGHHNAEQEILREITQALNTSTQ